MRHVHQVSEELEQWGGKAITFKSGHVGMGCGAPYGLMWVSLCMGVSCGMLYQYAKYLNVLPMSQQLLN